MSEHLATITLLTSDDGVQVDVKSDLHEAELGEILHVVADEMQGNDRPRAADAWGYRPE